MVSNGLCHKTESLIRERMNLFDFTEEDLKLNQRGYVSPRQREWLNMTARGIRNSSWTSVYVTVGFLFLGLCIIMALYLQNEDSRGIICQSPQPACVSGDDRGGGSDPCIQHLAGASNLSAADERPNSNCTGKDPPGRRKRRGRHRLLCVCWQKEICLWRGYEPHF